MEISDNLPIMVFDNQCYLCVKFAKFFELFAKRKVTMVGHYSDFGSKIREEVLDESALDMFWFIDGKKAYGGRAALLPLIKIILKKNTKKSSILKINENCDQNCKTVKAVFIRSSSLFTNSKKIDL